MNSRKRFLNAIEGKSVDRTPAWFMRQAGRYLPEYRSLKEKYDFLTMVKTPDLATEVTLQPLRRFPVDGAILFSDILVIPEALGQGYHFREGGGIAMEYSITSYDQVERLDTESIQEKLSYVAQTLRQLRKELGTEKALLGFGGSPWTLATYMVEGGSSSGFSKVKALFRREQKLFDALLEKLADALIDYFKMQIASGADAIQIFDSWASVADENDYNACSLSWIKQIIAALPEDFPVILYAKGVSHRTKDLATTGAHVLSLDWTANLPEIYDSLGGKVALQGNLDPALLTTNADAVYDATAKLLRSMHGRKRYIFNLGHGITPDAKIDCVDAMFRAIVENKTQI